jgi:hypothetical protein
MGDFIAVAGNAAASLPGQARRMDRHVSTKVLLVPNAGRALPDVHLSDHSPFWDQGYDSVMVTDTSLLTQPAQSPHERQDRSDLSGRHHRGAG